MGRVQVALLLLGTAQLIVAAKLPSFIPTCKKDAPNFDKCLIDSVETLRPHLAKGIPSLKIPPLEPLVIPALEVNRNTDALKVKAKMRDIRAYGGSQFIVNRLKVDPSKLTVDSSITIPKLRISADFDIDGRLLGLNIKNKGLFMGNLTNAKADVKSAGTLVKNKKGVEVLEVKKIDLKLKVDNQKFDFINKGGKNEEALARSAMNFYRQNQKQVDELVMPIVEETAEAFILQLSNAILRNIPWSEIKEHM